jgi:eukaryotic-like serine/threonine-protein kinase
VLITVSSGESSGVPRSPGDRGDASAPRAARDQREETSTVPNVVGLTSSEARAELRAAGFGVSVREEATTDEDQHGTVLRQSPSGGSDAERGANVVIVVGRFEEPPPDDRGSGGGT